MAIGNGNGNISLPGHQQRVTLRRCDKQYASRYNEQCTNLPPLFTIISISHLPTVCYLFEAKSPSLSLMHMYPKREKPPSVPASQRFGIGFGTFHARTPHTYSHHTKQSITIKPTTYDSEASFSTQVLVSPWVTRLVCTQGSGFSIVQKGVVCVRGVLG